MPITVEIAKDFRIEAAHFLPNVAADHQCHTVHGHSYLITLRVKGPIDEKLGWVMDLSHVSDTFFPLHKKLDHAFLNNIEGLENPTSENLAIWIMRNLVKDLPLLSSVTVEATNRLAVTVYRQDLDM